MLGVLLGCHELGCSSGSETIGAGGGPPLPVESAELGFDEVPTLTMSPGAVEVVGLGGRPAAPYRIALSLVGQALDAWLDTPVVVADASTGHATFELHAPSLATTFRLRASLLDERGAPGPSAERAVAVSGEGFATLRVVPSYQGIRHVDAWSASVAALTTCTDLALTLPQDPPGALLASAATHEEVVVENVPVGPKLAVVLRAGHYAWGCTEIEAPAPNRALFAEVVVIDKPLDLSHASLATTFEYGVGAADLQPIFTRGSALLAEAFLPSGSKIGAVVLNGMQALVSAQDKAIFTQRRIDEGWDQIAAQHFAQQPTGLRERLESWMSTGLDTQSPSFEAILAAGATSGQVMLTPTRFGDADPQMAGMTDVLASWSTEPQDSVLISASLEWEPSRFAGAAALGPALQDVPAASSVADALALAGDCSALASALGAFGSCDIACVRHLCSASIEARFGAALGASQEVGMLGEIIVKAAASATISDAAEPITLVGTWVGDFTDGVSSAKVSGALTAAPPAYAALRRSLVEP